MSDSVPDAVEARPWVPADGHEPLVRTWPAGDRPGMRVRLGGRWRRGVVAARMEWPDRLVYQVTVSMGGGVTSTRTYRWPQPGLRAAWRSASEPVATARLLTGG
ncbi:hypothetical protein [Streptomyces lavendulocolor]|uniref:hypothetical protein n=1 Tax=Streptomyces lavendulocolor TaxID=67316 RepID=UPI003C2B2AD8